MKHKWPLTKLGDILSERRETPTDDDLASGNVRIIDKISFDSGRIQLRLDGSTKTGMILVRPGDLVLSGINAAKGAIAIYDAKETAPVAATIHYGAYEANPQRADVRFLWWMLRSHFFQELLLEYVPGGIKTELKAKRLLPVPVPLPSLAEQRRVVARIEELAGQIKEARALRTQATEEADSLWHAGLHTAVTGGLTSQRDDEYASVLLKKATARAPAPGSKHNNAHSDSPDFLDQGPAKIPTNWQWTTLGSVLSHLVDCVNDTPDFAENNTGFVGLKSTNVRPYNLDLSRSWFVTQDDFNRWNRRESPRGGDIVLTREAPMGNACILPDGNFCLTQRLLLLRSDPEIAEAKFVLHFLNSSVFTDQVAEHCRGLTTPHIRVQDAPNFRFPLPPLNEQRRIMAELDALQAEVDALKRVQAETAAELDALLPSILDKAFKGEL